MTAADTATLCRELDALARRNDALDGENRALRCLVDELRGELASLHQRLDQARWRRGW